MRILPLVAVLDWIARSCECVRERGVLPEDTLSRENFVVVTGCTGFHLIVNSELEAGLRDRRRVNQKSGRPSA